MNPTREELQATLSEAREKLSKIEERERREAHAAMIGKCFRYKDNNYGHDSGKWDVYYKVTGGTRSYWPRAFRFETDCNGKIEIEPDHHLSPSAEPIPNGLFDREWAKVRKRIAKLCPSQPASTKKKAKQDS